MPTQNPGSNCTRGAVQTLFIAPPPRVCNIAYSSNYVDIDPFLSLVWRAIYVIWHLVCKADLGRSCSIFFVQPIWWGGGGGVVPTILNMLEALTFLN